MPEAGPPPTAPRGTCPRCRQPAGHCWCARLLPQASRVRLALLQHPREARNPVGTARMAHLSVPGSQLLVGIDFEGDPRIGALLAAGPGVVLYPARGARDARELAARPDPLTVFVIDGTWWQAEKIWQRNGWLRRLDAYRLEPARPSAYEIRAEPEPHCVSTLEAVAYLLDALEGAPGSHAPMVAPLSALVERQRSFSRGAARTPRRRLRPRSRPPPRLPAPLQGGVERALIFHGEGNGWPAREARPAELVHWLALRPSTGERFACLVEPPSGRSPTMPGNLALGEAELAAAVDVAELRRRWAAFARPDDLWCGWGHFPAGLLARAGIAPPPHLDLRRWCNERLRSRVASPEHAHRALGLAAVQPWAPGRGGRRMALLAAVFDALSAREEPRSRPGAQAV